MNRAECAAAWDKIWLLVWQFDIALPAGERAAVLRELGRLAAAGASAAEREARR